MYLPPSSGLADQWACYASMAMPSQASGFGWPAAPALMDPAWVQSPHGCCAPAFHGWGMGQVQPSCGSYLHTGAQQLYPCGGEAWSPFAQQHQVQQQMQQQQQHAAFQPGFPAPGASAAAIGAGQAASAARGQAGVGERDPQVEGLASLLAQAVRQSAGGAKAKVKDVSAAEANAVATTLDPADVAPFIARFKNMCIRKDPRFVRLFALNAAQLASTITAGDDELAYLDAYVAGAVQCCLKPDSDAVKLFRKRNDGGHQGSGLYQLQSIARLAVLKPGVEMQNAEAAFKKKTFFVAGMGFVPAQLAAETLKAEFALLTNQCRSHFDVYRAIIGKLPDQISGKRDALADKINEWQSGGFPPWHSYDAFIIYVANLLSDGSPCVSAGDAGPADAGAGGLEANAAERAGGAPRPPCLICGSPDHGTKQCTRECKACKKAIADGLITVRSAATFCPAARPGERCAVTSKQFPRTVKNGLGKPLFSYGRKLLEKAHREYHGGDKREANAAERHQPRDDRGSDEDPIAAVDDGAVFGDGYVGRREVAAAEVAKGGVSETVPLGASATLDAQREGGWLGSSVPPPNVERDVTDGDMQVGPAPVYRLDLGDVQSNLGLACVLAWPAATAVAIVATFIALLALGGGRFGVDVSAISGPAAEARRTGAAAVAAVYSASASALHAATATACDAAAEVGQAAQRACCGFGRVAGLLGCLALAVAAVASPVAARADPASGAAASGVCAAAVSAGETGAAHSLQRERPPLPRGGRQTIRLEFQLDGGSNTCVVKHAPNAERGAVRLGDVTGVYDIQQRACSITGIGPAADVTTSQVISMRGVTGSGRALDIREAVFSDNVTRSIIAESYLEENYGADVSKVRRHIIWKDGRTDPIYSRNGLYFVTLEVVPVPSVSYSVAVAGAEAAAAKLRVDDRAALMAARFVTDAAGIVSISRAAHGVGVDKVNRTAAEVIDKDRFLALARSRKRAVHAMPPTGRAPRAGHTFVFDGFGRHEAPSPLNGHVYQFHGVCQYTSFGYTDTSTKHTADDWKPFMRHVYNDAQAAGHDPRVFVFDSGTDLVALKDWCGSEFGVTVRVAPRQHHEPVGTAEVNNDIVTRTAEAMLQRAHKGTSFLLPARVYAQHLVNFKPCSGQKESRYQRYYGKVPTVDEDRPLFLFGTRVMYNEEKETRGPKGSRDRPRATEGDFMGVDPRSNGSVYLVRKDNGGTARVRHVTQLDELQLLRRGIPTGAAVVEAATQTPPTGEQLTTPPRVRPSPRAAAPPLDLPKGSRVSVVWQDPAPAVTSSEYVGTVTEVVEQRGERLWLVTYDSQPDKPYAHNFANTKRKWRRLPPPTPAPPVDPVTEHLFHDGREMVEAEAAARAVADSGPTTRAQARRRHATALAAAAVEEALERTPSEAHVDVYNATLFAVLGEDAVPFECASAELLDARRASLRNAAGAVVTAECLKATQRLVDVSTPIGKCVYRVPANKKELLNSPEREHWLAADEKGLDCILRGPGNCLVPVTVPAAKGVPVQRCVTARKIKVDQATGRLDKHDPYKSRHSADGGFAKVQRVRAGLPASQVPATSTVVDDMTTKLFLGHAAAIDANLTKGDVGNAYIKAKRQGPVGYMSLPSTLPMTDEDGTQLCIELSTPLWGEESAGYEWECTFNETIKSLGWMPCPGVPAMFSYHGEHGEARMITIVDDFMISEVNGTAATDATIAALKAAFDGEVKVDYSPTSFAGLKLERDRERRTLTLSMPQKIIEAAREHMPELLRGERPTLLSGRRLAVAADSLKLADRDGKLTPQQVRTQSIIGHLKFVERVQPKLCLVLHRLSCVMSAPPPAAYDVARAALNMAYEHRDDGITYGGPRAVAELQGHMQAHIAGLDSHAPADLAAAADATWNGDLDLYGIVLTCFGAAVYHCTKKVGLIVDSSHECEAIATAKAGEHVSYARVVLLALGAPPAGPTVILSDNKANVLVANNAMSASRSRHFLRRYHTLQRRMAEGECRVVKIADDLMPADFLTKWVARDKLKRSVDFATNARARNGGD